MATGASRENGRFARRVAALAVVIVAVGAPLSACLPQGRFCSPGDFIACTTSTGSRGAAMCNDDGTAYGQCDSTLLLDGSLPPAPDGGDASEGDGGGCSGTTNLALLCACTSNAECASSVCNSFPSKGMFCTQPCTKDTDCPPPSPGCTPKGLCKVP